MGDAKEISSENAQLGSNGPQPISSNNGIRDEKKAANHANVPKSRRSRKRAGRPVFSRNAMDHGPIAVAPIVPGVESLAGWYGHLRGIYKELAPVGYVQQLLAKRIAEKLWRLDRVPRFESQVVTASIIADAGETADLAVAPRWPIEAFKDWFMESKLVRILESLSIFTDEKKLEKRLAVHMVVAICKEIPAGVNLSPVPGIPSGYSEFIAFSGWTVGLIRKVILHCAAASGMTPDILLGKCLTAASERREKAKKQASDLCERRRVWKSRFEGEKYRRMVLEPHALHKLACYEHKLERSLFELLLEFKRLQAARLGAADAAAGRP